MGFRSPENVAGIGLHSLDVRCGRRNSRVGDFVALAPPFVESIAKVTEPGSQETARGLDADPAADAAPLSALEMSGFTRGVSKESPRLNEELSRASGVGIDEFDLSSRHDILSASGAPMSGITGPRMIPPTKLFPLRASDANSAGV